MRPPRRLPALALIALTGRAAHADGPPSPAPAPPPAAPAPAPPAPAATSVPSATPRKAADAVLAAWKAKDDAAVTVWASNDDPDAWIVADELIRRGEFDAAEAFAKAAPRVDVAGLPAYVASRRGKPDDPRRRARCAAAGAALSRDEPIEALDALGPAVADPIEDVVGVRLQTIRGRALSLAERHEEAAPALLAAAEAAERLGWLYVAALTYDDGASSLMELEEFAASRDATVRALAISVRRGDRSDECSALSRLGILYPRLGEYAKAIECLERALAFLREAGDPADVAGTLINLGNVHEALGDYPKALECLRRGLEGAEAAGAREFAANALNSLSTVYTRLGDYPKAIATCERARAAFEALGLKVGAAGALDRLGSIHDRLGDFARALELYERALAAMEELGNKPAVAATLTNIGIARMQIGDHEEAIEAHERALVAFEALGDKAGAIAARINLGGVHTQMGDHAKALACYERGVHDAQAIGHRQWAVNAIDGLRSVYAARGDFAKALEYGERELALKEELGDRTGLVGTLLGVASARAGLRDWAGAVAAARRGASIVPLIAAGLADGQGATARAQFALVFDVGARAAAERQDVDAVFEFLESGRAGSLLEALSARTALQSELVPPALAAEEAHAHAREASALGAYRRALDGGDLAVLRARRRDLDEARAAVETAVERIQRDAKAAANVVHFEPDDLAAIRERLGPDEAFVAYGLSDEGSLALVATRAGASTAKLPEAEVVEAACDALLTAIGDGTAAGTADASADAVRRTADVLRDLVVAPLGLPPGTARILVSPDGSLSYVPFTLLAPDREVVYVTSGTTYGLLLEDGKARGDGVLALGDPDYASKVDEGARDVELRRSGTGVLSRLPATATEATSIGAPVLLQKAATERGLREAVAKRPRWRAVHFACHGLIDSDRPSFSSLALTAGGEDDGFLTVLEIFRSKLHADLVVLSACETAKGKVVRGEGIMGLTRAFMFAGAPRVICSLWKVDDEATQALMVKFYEFWNPKEGPGLPTAQALRRAQEFVRSQARWKHPYFWAAWVLWGLP